MKIRKHKILHDFTTSDGICPACNQVFGRPFLLKGKPVSFDRITHQSFLPQTSSIIVDICLAAGSQSDWRHFSSLRSKMSCIVTEQQKPSGLASNDESSAVCDRSRPSRPITEPTAKTKPKPPARRKSVPAAPPRHSQRAPPAKAAPELPGDEARADGAVALLKHMRQLRGMPGLTTSTALCLIAAVRAQDTGKAVGAVALQSASARTQRNTCKP